MLRILASHIRKDFSIEIRSRSTFTVALAFSVITTLSISLSAGGTPFRPVVHAVLLWIIIFFSAMSGLAHVFTREEEEETSLFLRLAASPEIILTAKLLFNILFLLLMSAVAVPLYVFFLDVAVRSPGYLAAVIALGSFSIAAATTLLAAIVAKSGARGALFTIVSFPIVLPVLWVSIRASVAALTGSGSGELSRLLFLLAFSGALIAVSYMLFEHIWIED